MDDLTHPTLTNIPEFSVSEIAGAIRRSLEVEFGKVRVRGEITELRAYSSGHTYFCLKDQGAKLKSVVWKSAGRRLGVSPENGVEVVATGKISSYPDRSEYQLVIEQLEYAGAGALLARVEALRQRLLAEGLFDARLKRPLPAFPGIIGVVTSPQGAVIHDILTTIARRCPCPVLLWPVAVQGEAAATQVAGAIRGFSSLLKRDALPVPDVLIIARGGGSLEDLMAFNDEDVVREAAACPIPLISAVGHETDTTLIDFVSDRRAATPTAAAEMAVPAISELDLDLQQKSVRLAGAINRHSQQARLRLQRADHALPDAGGLLAAAGQRLDDRAHRLALALPNILRERRSTLVAVERHLFMPHTVVGRSREALLVAGRDLRSAVQHVLQSRHAEYRGTGGRLNISALRALLREARLKLGGVVARLDTASHGAVLNRGYAAVFDGRGAPVTRAASVRPGTLLRVTFADGEVRAVALRRGTGAQEDLPL